VIVESREGGGLGGAAAALASQFGGIASLAGLDVTGLDAAGRKAQAVLKSRNLAEEFVKRNGLTSELMARSTQKQTLWRAVEMFRKRVVSFRDEKRAGTTTVAIDWKDAATAARWANAYVALANELIRAAVIDDASRNIAFLNGQVSRTNVVEIQHVMYKLIEDQTKTLMLASGRIDYAFHSVDPAVAPEIRASPQRTLIVLGGLVLGLVIGGFAAFLHDLSSRTKGGP
jgi:LPS O-antigen subunit length determinant protein (WzzB/FepE family)